MYIAQIMAKSLLFHERDRLGDLASGGALPVTVRPDPGENELQVDLPQTARDAFGRLRVSNPQTIFDSNHIVQRGSFTWDEVVAAGGSITHTANFPAVTLSVDGTPGGLAVKKTLS